MPNLSTQSFLIFPTISGQSTQEHAPRPFLVAGDLSRLNDPAVLGAPQCTCRRSFQPNDPVVLGDPRYSRISNISLSFGFSAPLSTVGGGGIVLDLSERRAFWRDFIVLKCWPYFRIFGCGCFVKSVNIGILTYF